MYRLNNLEGLEAKRNIITSFFIAIILVFTIFDILSDQSDGVGTGHLVVEGLIVACCVVSLFFLWSKTLSLSLKRIRATEGELLETKHSVEKWRSRAEDLLKGLGEAIHGQFIEWNLTEAEQDVGLLLLKGLTIKEIASMRECSEKTVRHHASSIYHKSGLQGRSELSAFFLEDLLLPLHQTNPSRA
ncbi:MAG: response regulator transcription factor [Bdellovibrionales bacterium]|nr:response regulator transcription factor [Bdellovibrionales bacterium]